MDDLSKVKTKLESLTPEVAQRFLDSTQKAIDAGEFRQRPLSSTTVDRYVRDIKLSAWAASPQTISIDVNGRVIDGRHRLAAIVQAGIPVVVNLSTGWPPIQKCGKLNLNTIDVIDRGRLRGIGSQLSIGHGIANGNYHAAVAACIAQICCDSTKISVSVPQVLLILEIYKDSADAIFGISGDSRKRNSAVCAPLAFCHVTNQGDVEKFAEKYFSLEGLHSGHPALALIKWLGHHPTVGGAGRRDVTKVVLSCIRHFCNGSKLSKVYISQEAWLWATSQQKDNVRKVRQIIGVK